MLKTIIQEAIKRAQAEKERQIATARERVTREKIAPFNQDIDNSLREAVAELQLAHNEKIANMQKVFEQEKTALYDAAAQKKADFAATTIDTEIAVVTVKSDAVISNLRKIYEEQGE
jgi:F0F1-type ATP synthase membrane subunit b/b'